MRRRGHVWTMLLACLLALAGTARGQESTTSAAPYRGLFETGRVVNTATPGPSVLPGRLFTVEAFTQLEADTASTLSQALDAPRHANTSYTGADIGFARRITHRRLSYDFRAGSQVRRYHQGAGIDAGTQSAQVKIAARLSRRTSVAVAGRASYSPTFTVSIPLTAAAPDAPEAGLGVEVRGVRNASFSTTGSVTRVVDRRTVIDLGYAANRVAYFDRDDLGTGQKVSARARRDLGQGIRLQARYDFGVADSHPAGRSMHTVTHEAELGATYTPARSPETTFTISVTPTAMDRTTAPATALADATAGTEQYRGVRLGALVGMTHRVSERWRMGLSYQRALYTDAGVVQPAFAQTTSGRLEARISRRARVTGMAAFSTGLPNPELPNASMPDSVGTSARWTVATSTWTAVFAEFQRTTYLRSTRLDRQVFRIGATVNFQRH